MKLFLLATCLILMTGCQQTVDESKPANRFEDIPPSQQGSCLLSGEEGPSDLPGIINGQPLSSSSRIARGTVFVVALQVMSGVLVESHCTGVLVGPRLVLTAAHCVPTQSGMTEEERGASTRILFTVDPNCAMVRAADPTNMRDVARVKVHPMYDSNEHINDLALVFLSSNAPSGTRPLPIFLSEVSVPGNQEVFVAGYGRDTDLSSGVSSSPRLRFTTLFQSADPNPPTRSPQHPDNDLLILDTDRGTGVCSGDSGGPALITWQGKLQTLGIASFVYDHDWQRATCLSRAAYTRLSVFKDWILATAGRWIWTSGY